MDLGLWGLPDIPQKNFFGTFEILKMEPTRLAKNAFSAYSYGHEVS